MEKLNVIKTAAVTPCRADSLKILKQLGSTNYEVSVFFNNDSRETLSDKLMRLIRNEICGRAVGG